MPGEFKILETGIGVGTEVGKQPSTAQIIDLVQLFQKQFGSKPYVINQAGELSNNPSEAYQVKSSTAKAEKEFTKKGSLLKETINGISILLPVKFFNNGGLVMSLPYVVVSIRGKKTIVETPMVQRKGSVKEQYSIDDYSMVVKGFLIADDKGFPEDLYVQMKEMYELETALVVENALFNIFLTDPELPSDEQRRVVIYDIDFPEVTGGRHAKPFVMNLKSDTVFTLELDS